MRFHLRVHTEGFDVGPGQIATTGDAFGGLELIGHVDVPGGRTTRSGMHTDIGAEGHPAHRFDATADPDVERIGGDQTGDQMGRLLGGTALAVDGGTPGLPGKTGMQPCGPRHVVGLFASLRDAPPDDLFDEHRIESRTIE
ncbi:hypothetical protein AS032_32720 [Rhodococcus qingshengii]|nr:hypothetical protein AOT96_30795 [Rhodococcus sp. 008]ARE37701.1 hypothetical protein A0W34_29620 [Rhodococcus sp. BH4]KDQ05001.1 hypothetical protein EN35_17865 [Rhodococcus qingshengii]KSU65437.1 hypothetical protein AS032_32720 [Rhodococcus qingshengii]KZF15134.1 hypothetical protein A2J01_32410 [Rhodococcus sp. EPR-134]